MLCERNSIALQFADFEPEKVIARASPGRSQDKTQTCDVKFQVLRGHPEPVARHCWPFLADGCAM